MTVILYAILIAHLNSYRNFYANIGITFATTYVIKKLIKSSGSHEQADLIGLGGYTLTIGEFVKLISAIKHAGFQGGTKESNEIIGGLLGKCIDSIKDMVVK